MQINNVPLVRVLGACFLAFAIAVFPFPAGAGAQAPSTDSDAEPPAAERQPHTKPAKGEKTADPSRDVSLNKNWGALFAPATNLYPVYLADPRAPTAALTAVSYRDSEIPEAGDRRYVFRIGGRLGLLRIFPSKHVDRGFQLSLHGTFLGMFDQAHSLDNIGWDGLYGFDLNWRHQSGLALKLGLHHDSSHLGDEYAERTGRQRINYTRQEYVLGMSLPVFSGLRVYGEAGRAFDLRNEAFQEKWRVQSGLEFESHESLFNNRMGYYGALDLVSFEESDWEPEITVQAGLTVPAAQLPRRFRIGLEYRDGRSLIGELAQFEEASWAFGIWIDL